MIDDCEKSGCENKVFYRDENMRLVGMVTVNICREHLREWEMSDTSNHLWGQLAVTDRHVSYGINSAAGQTPISWEEINDQVDKGHRIREKLRRLVVAWLDSKKTVEGLSDG